MSGLPDPDALLDGIVRAKRNRGSSPKSPRLALTPPRVDLKQKRYPVLPDIAGRYSVRCDVE